MSETVFAALWLIYFVYFDLFLVEIKNGPPDFIFNFAEIHSYPITKIKRCDKTIKNVFDV